MSQLPVIFLAFANDHQQSYLHNLTVEQDAIRAALQSAADKGLCEVVYETDTDLNKIWKVFDRYQDRISIFHYAGHATDYTLLLKSASGKHQVAHAEGLVSFLGKQKGLKLVFINGCSSKRQTEELRDRGVPAVIGTARPIDDEMATQLSGKFYESLAEGRSLEQAWLGASDYVKAQTGNQGFSASTFMDDEDEEDGASMVDFPWDLYIRPGAEQVKSWNLAREARNPLFNLPLPESYFLRLRNSPFVGLHFFQEDDSALFFGRGAQIRELYNHLKGIHPIILLYGKSGVGKSSMLDAGLLPRIQGEFYPVYARRIQEKGLLGTLELALAELLKEEEEAPIEEAVIIEVEDKKALEAERRQQAELQQMLVGAKAKSNDPFISLQIDGLIKRLAAGKSSPSNRKRKAQIPAVQLTSILKQWQAIEKQTGKALVIILDQVEEKYTRPMPGETGSAEDELVEFLSAIQPLFSGGNTGIKGKLIMSYRKEYHPEIRDTFQDLSLPYAELFLKRLDREGIIEAIQGVNMHEITKQKYQLRIEKNLPEIIADDLMEDSESPIAPVLQIIMEKLWATSFKEEHQPVKCTVSGYQELRKEGTTMDEFFQQQMDKLTESLPEEVASGLALDILHSHTTNLGTAGSCKRADLLAQYDIPDKRLIFLIQELQDLSLLVRIDQRQAGSTSNDANYTTILAHDTIAPIVIRAYNVSDTPGQRAMRILTNKLSDIGYRLQDEDAQKLLTLSEFQDNGGPPIEASDLQREYIGPMHFRNMIRNAVHEDPDGKIEQDMLARSHVNLQPQGLPVFFEESDLLIIEQGSGMTNEGEDLPGMAKLPKAGEAIVALSKEKRAERIKKAKANRRVRLLGVAVITALMFVAVGFWYSAQDSAEKAESALITAKKEEKKAQENLKKFLSAKAEEITKEVDDILERESELRSKYPIEARKLLAKADTILADTTNPPKEYLKDIMKKVANRYNNYPQESQTVIRNTNTPSTP